MFKKKEAEFVSFTGEPFNSSQAIILNGNHFDIGTSVATWKDLDGFNSYDKSVNTYFEDDRKTGKKIKKVIKGSRYSKRKGGVSAIKQIVQHHTGGFTAKQAFNTLHNVRKLSVQFLTDDHGMIYQPLDAVECAWHAGDLNGSSIGIENVLFPDAKNNPEAYSEARCKRLGLEPHEVDKISIQGMNRNVFLLPENQVSALVNLTSGIWAALAYEDILHYGKYVPPYFMHDSDRKVLRIFSKDYKSHIGQLLHANSKSSKWDLAGIKDLESFEKRVADRFYEFVKTFASVENI